MSLFQQIHSPTEIEIAARVLVGAELDIDMSDITTVDDRCRCVLVGLAAGDRIGGPIRMAVRLAESLLACGNFDPADILKRHLGWWREGAFDTGPVSDRALELMASGMPAQVHREFGGMTAGCKPAHRSPPQAMLASILAKAYKPQELAHDAYPLYERFRPDVPAGKKGWGAEGDLDMGLIEGLAKEKS